MKSAGKSMCLQIADLNTSRVQAAWRTTGKQSMSDLVASIQRYGLLSDINVALVDGEYILVNGHRRTHASAALGNKTISARVVEVATLAEAEAMFAEIDRVTLKQKGKDRLYGWGCASNRAAYLSALSANQRFQIVDFVKVFGVACAEAYACGGADPGVVSKIRVLDRYLRRWFEPPALKAIGTWVLKHRGASVANILVRTGGKRDAAKLLACIEEDRPFAFPRKGVSET